jgi:hypothetical protein
LFTWGRTFQSEPQQFSKQHDVVDRIAFGLALDFCPALNIQHVEAGATHHQHLGDTSANLNNRPATSHSDFTVILL